MRTKVSLGWVVVISVLVGLVIAPIGVQAAGSFVMVNDEAGRKALVSKANQLLVSPAAPDQFFNVDLLNITSTCRQIVAPPAGKALVIEVVRYNVYQVNPGLGQWIASFVGTDCNFNGIVDLANPPSVGPITSDFGPGLTIPAGKALWVRTSSTSVAGDAYVSGYLVPAAAVPSTPVLSGSPSSPRAGTSGSPTAVGPNHP